MWLFFRQPKFLGKSKMLKIQSEEEFNEIVLSSKRPDVKGSKKGQNTAADYSGMNMWCVEFYVDWAETCTYVRRIKLEYILINF